MLPIMALQNFSHSLLDTGHQSWVWKARSRWVICYHTSPDYKQVERKWPVTGHDFSIHCQYCKFNYCKNNSVHQKLKADNSGIIKANCMAHILYNCAKHAGDRLDIESVVNKILSHMLKTYEELKAVLAFVEEDYRVLLRHIPQRWLSLWPAVKRLHNNWTAVRSYFLSLGEDQCPKSPWQHFKKDQDSDGQPLELQVCLSFLNNVLEDFPWCCAAVGGRGRDRLWAIWDYLYSQDKAPFWNGDQCYLQTVSRPKDGSNQTWSFQFLQDCIQLPQKVVWFLQQQLPEECYKLGTEEQVHILPSLWCSGGPPDKGKTGHGCTKWRILCDIATPAGNRGEKRLCCGEVVNLT